MAEIEIQGYSTVLCLSLLLGVDRILDQPWRNSCLPNLDIFVCVSRVSYYVADEVFAVYLYNDFAEKVSWLHEVLLGCVYG